MLAFFKRSSKKRNNDKHSAKTPLNKQEPPPESAVVVVAAQDEDRSDCRYKSQTTDTAAAGRHNQRAIVAVQQHQTYSDTADNLASSSNRPFEVPPHSENETVGEQRRAGNLFAAAVSATANASTAPPWPIGGRSASENTESATPIRNINKSPAAAPPAATNKFSGFLGEIMAKGRNRRHNQSAKKHKPVQNPSNTTTIVSASKEPHKPSRYNCTVENDPVSHPNNHQQSSADITYAEDCNDDDYCYTENSKPARKQTHDDVDPPPPPTGRSENTFKNSQNQVEFIDVDARQSDEVQPIANDYDDQCRNSTTVRDCTEIRRVLSNKATDKIVDQVKASDSECSAVENHSEVADFCNTSINDPDRRERIGEGIAVEQTGLLGAQTSDNDLRHDSCQTNTTSPTNNTSPLVKNSFTYDHHGTSSTFKSTNAVKEHPTGVASFRNQTFIERPPILQPIVRAPLASVSDEDDDDDDNSNLSTFELDLISVCNAADAPISLPMGQQPTKSTATPNSPKHQRIPESRSQVDHSQSIPQPQVLLRSNTPPSVPSSYDDRDIFYEAVDDRRHSNLPAQHDDPVNQDAPMDTETAVNCSSHQVDEMAFLNFTENSRETNINNDELQESGENGDYANDERATLPTVIINDDNHQLALQGKLSSGHHSEDTDDDNDDDDNDEEDDFAYCGENNRNPKHADNEYGDADSDDPENDSPDSGIDVVTDSIAGGNLAAASDSVVAGDRPLSLSPKSNLLTSGGEHLVRSTSSGLESDLSDEPSVKPPSQHHQGASPMTIYGHSAFSSGWDADQTVGHKCPVSESVPWSVNGSKGQDDGLPVSLPDIVESIGANQPTITVGSSHNGLTIVSAGSQYSGHGRDSSSSASSSDTESNEFEKDTSVRPSQEIMEEKMRDLVNQEARFSVQLEAAEKQAFDSEAKANDLSYQISELERNLTVKIWNVERLQAELQAAYQEGECVKRKVKQQEAEMEVFRKKFSAREEELESVYHRLEEQHQQLQIKFDKLQSLASALQMQLAAAQSEAAAMILEKENYQKEHAEQCQKLQAAIEAAIAEKDQLEFKWQNDFEQLRTHHSDREEHLLNDCEWKLRSTEQSCKAKLTAAETAKREALERAEITETEAHRQLDEVKHLRSYEAEVTQLRSLTTVQSESIVSMTKKLDDLKEELEEANQTVNDSLETVRKIKFQCEQEISDKHRLMINKIDEARGEVAVIWEDRLMEEMSRLKIELESCYAEDRAESLQIAGNESLAEINALKDAFSAKEKELWKEIAELKSLVDDRSGQLAEANERSDKQVMQIRNILERSEREHEREISMEVAKRDEITESMRSENEKERQRMEEIFRERLLQVSEEFANELTNNKDELEARHKKKMEQQFEKLMAEKEEVVQNLERKYKRQITDSETKLRDMEIEHQRNLKDMKSQQSMDKSSFEQRDIQSAQEIDQLHKKCRCLTKLFEEMRMRYERRDPRPEDLRDIEELKCRIEAQDRDLCQMTEKLREFQLHSQPGSGANNQQNAQRKPKAKGNNNNNNNNKSKMNNCNVIYEENEDREASPTIIYTKTVDI